MTAAAPEHHSALQISELSLSFGGVQALNNVTFRVEPGSIHAVIGPNGAGKTTLLNCISGLYTPTGSIRYGKTELTLVRPHHRIRLGIARTFQHINVFSELSVLENIMLGGHHRLRSGLFRRSLFWGRWGCRDEEQMLSLEAHEMLEKLNMNQWWNLRAGELSYGMQKKLEIGRALLARPGLLLMDEPMAGMTQAEKQELSGLIDEINRNESITIVMIEHDMSVVQSLSRHTIVLDFGKKIAEGSPADVVKDEQVRKAYLGEDLA